MSEDTHNSMLQVMALLGDDERYKTRLAEYDKRRRDAEAAEAKLAEAIARHDSSKQEADYFVAKRQNELAAAQVEHDTVAKEAAARLDLGREQAAELLRLAQEVDAAKKKADAREKEIEQREKAIAVRERDVAKLAETVDRERAELKSRHERLRAAMG